MIKIMVDSSSDYREKGKIDLFIPMSVNIDGKEYKDGIDLDNDTFYSLLKDCKEFPKTSQPSPDDFIKVFERVKEDKDELIYFSLSSALSGTYQSAVIAKSIVEYNNIYIVDTKNASHMIIFLVEYARNLVAEGYAAADIAEKCEELKGKIKVFAGVDTLEYLKRGGRISKTLAMVGTLANIKPLITVTPSGEVDSAGKGLGVAKAIQMISEKVCKFEFDENFPIYSLYTYGEENCEKLEEKLKANGINITERKQIGSTIGVHLGPGVYGVCFVIK